MGRRTRIPIRFLCHDWDRHRYRHRVRRPHLSRQYWLCRRRWPHVSIDYRGPICGCGKHGCIEILAAGPAIGARARTKLAGASRHSAILDLAKGDIAAVTSELVGQAYGSGDPLAREVLQETVELLTAWLGNIVDLLDPDVLVLGGGVAAMLRPFFDEIKNRLPSWCVNPHASAIPLFMAHYGADAGIAGGAALCSEILP